MPHLDQHSALPPESIMGCDNTHHFGLFISQWMMWLLLLAAVGGGGASGDDDDVVVVSKWIENLLLKFNVYSIFD